MKTTFSACIVVSLAASFAIAQSTRPAVNVPTSAPASAGNGLFWYKGNTHTHTWWSDGDSPPETVIKWYKDHGYNFLMLSDHDKLAEGEKWYRPKTGSHHKAAAAYEATFGPEWVIKRGEGEEIEYRLRTFREFRELFRDDGRFLLIQGEEISDGFRGNPIHVNAVNTIDVIPPQKGESIADTVQRNVAAVKAQEARYKQPMLAHVNHPHFRWALTTEDLIPLKADRFFEIFNGHPDVHNYGDENRPSCERMWDVIITKRIAELKLPIMYGVATDDAHAYTRWGGDVANPGRGFVVVRAADLTPSKIVLALQNGEFYASTGVMLKDLKFENGTLSIEIDAKPGVQYKTEFIGTLQGYDPDVADRYKDPRGFLYNKYSDTIGKVLATATGSKATYTMTGKEIYVRAKITSTAPHPNPFQAGDVEVAWVQPVVGK